MKHLNFYRVIAIMLLAAAQALAVGVGDYVDYGSEGSKSPERGTVVAVSEGGELTIRPHRTQGDFKAAPELVRVVKDAAALAALQPKAGEYSINLMWVNFRFSRSGYVFPDDRDLEARLAKVAAWAQANPGEQVVVWYDSDNSLRKAAPNTKRLLAEKYPDQASQITFKDLREFPEAQANPAVFSDELPGYFRVDLLRVICAYHVLTQASEQGKRHYFVYADIDVTPMTKGELFDAPTQMDLDKFGIVMAHGGSNPYHFENSFQIWSNNKPNLLKAAKAAIIDVNIIRAKNSLASGTTNSLEQEIYNSYDAMFFYDYQLENWGVAKDLFGRPLDPEHKGLISAFGQQGLASIGFDIEDPELRFDEESFHIDDGANFSRNRLYIPRKIIAAPASRFGGRPTQFDPNVITPRNYAQKLGEALLVRPFDGYLLLVAVRNNDASAVEKIVRSLSPEELGQAVLTATFEYDKFKSTPLIAAFDEGHTGVIQTILEKLQGHAALLKQAAEAVVRPAKNKNLLLRLAKKGDAESLKHLFQAFAPVQGFLELVADGLSTVRSGITPLREAIANNRIDVIKQVFEQYQHDQKLMEKLSASLLDSEEGMRDVLQGDAETIRLLRQTFLKDFNRLAHVLLKQDRGGDTFLGNALGNTKIGEINALVADLDFMSRWAQTLTRQNRFGFNVFHSAARNYNARVIQYLGEQFAGFPEIIRQALQATDEDGKTPFELARDEATKKALTNLLQVVSKFQ